MFAIWRDALMAVGSPGLSSGTAAARGVAGLLGLDNSPVGRFGSAVIQIPEKSGLPSARRGAGADIFTLSPPSAALLRWGTSPIARRGKSMPATYPERRK